MRFGTIIVMATALYAGAAGGSYYGTRANHALAAAEIKIQVARCEQRCDADWDQQQAEQNAANAEMVHYESGLVDSYEARLKDCRQW
jgi:hypothetical protein